MAYEVVLAALADPTRRAILERIVESPRAAGEVAQGLPISQPAVSQHLRVLREAELVREERVGTRRIYHANPAALGELRAYVDNMWMTVLGSFVDAAGKRGQES